MTINYDEFISESKELCARHDLIISNFDFTIQNTESRRLPSGTPGCAAVRSTGKQNINIVITEYF